MYEPTTPWPRHGTKRKSLITPETVPIAPPPEKHFITEEEMADEMHRLQLEEQALQSTAIYNTTAQSPFSFNTQGQFSGFGDYPHVQASTFNSAQMPGLSQPGPFTMNQNMFTSNQQSAMHGVETVEMDSEVPDDTREIKSELPRLRVSEDLLSMKPEGALPRSLVEKIVAPYCLALVPYMPLQLPPLETQPIVTEPEEDVAMGD